MLLREPIPYPSERVPKHAILSLAHFRRGAGRPPPSILDIERQKFVTRGTHAIALCLADAGIGAADAVLVPAYHCTTMIWPVKWRGARPAFYRINEDTSVDFDDLERKVERDVRVVLAPHYFGFPQDATRLRAFCDRHGLVYIEDCAHAFFGSHAGAPLGSFGDYAIASPWKFFPTTDGGMIVSTRRSLDAIRTVPPGAYVNAKSLLNALEHAFERDRLRGLKILLSLPLKLQSRAWRLLKGGASRESSPAAGELQDDGAQLDESRFRSDNLLRGMSWPAQAAVRYAALARIADERRRNYMVLEDVVRGLPGCRPLFPSLPAEVVPQVFPLWVNEPAGIFSRLKYEGVPIIRFGEFLWPGVDASVCPTSVELSRRVFQFPCHQDLRPAELQWMAQRIVAAFTNEDSVLRSRFPSQDA